jgi:subtilisin family serine protease
MLSERIRMMTAARQSRAVLAGALVFFGCAGPAAASPETLTRPNPTVASTLPAPRSGVPTSVQAETKIHPALTRLLNQTNAPVRTWVFFTDKGVHTPREIRTALDAVAASYTPRATQRRALRRTVPAVPGFPALFDERDIPVLDRYADAVVATGATLRTTSRWVNAVSVMADRDQVDQISKLPFVRALQPVRYRKVDQPNDLMQVPDEQVVSTRAPEGFYGRAAAQLNQIGLIALHNEGYTASGVVIGILDTGFKRDHDAFNNPSHPLNIIAEWDFVDGDPNTAPEPGDPSGQHSHGTWILGTIGSYLPNELVGGAYDASFILCKTEDITGEYQGEEDFYVAGLEFIELHGGDLATSSLGYIDWYTQADLNGLTAVTTIGVNTATANGMYCCTAAGNSGHDTDPTTSHLIAPADALQVITVGAVASTGEIAGFSSDGPTADGRNKPDLLARGVSTHTISSSSNTSFSTLSGTSLSTPLAASAVACLVQARPTWTVDQMRDMLFTSADIYLATGTFDPLYIQGYGLIDAIGAFNQDCNANGVRDSVDITSGTSKDLNGNGVPDECECYADCDTSTGLGVLDIFDFLCFQNDFVAGGFYACDCDRSTGGTVCDIFDFLCFQDRFVNGCP